LKGLSWRKHAAAGKSKPSAAGGQPKGGPEPRETPDLKHNKGKRDCEAEEKKLGGTPSTARTAGQDRQKKKKRDSKEVGGRSQNA